MVTLWAQPPNLKGLISPFLGELYIIPFLARYFYGYACALRPIAGNARCTFRGSFGRKPYEFPSLFQGYAFSTLSFFEHCVYD